MVEQIHSLGDTPKDLTTVSVYSGVHNGERVMVFSPSQYMCTSEEYQNAVRVVIQWNPLEMDSPKMYGIVETYLRTGDPHEPTEDPFAEDQGFIDEW